MPCYAPLQGFFTVTHSGSRKVTFSNQRYQWFKSGKSDVLSANPDGISIPCGRCIGCRLERSRQWALRCVHEAKLHEDNCFITLTYSDKHLPKSGSLNKRDFQLFMKRLRKKFPDSKIRYYMCGEYGDQLSRPHYHAVIFGFDFPDKIRFHRKRTEPLFTSKILDSLWDKGHCTIGAMSFESAAYVARYCTKKITGPGSKEYYGDKLPEFATMSRRPGIGRGLYDQFKKDIYPSDFMIIRGYKCKPPRFYDKILEDVNPLMLEQIKAARTARADSFARDATYRRLKDREICRQAKFRQLSRSMEI